MKQPDIYNPLFERKVHTGFRILTPLCFLFMIANLILSFFTDCFHIFMTWNLFLAWLPAAFAFFGFLMTKKRRSGFWAKGLTLFFAFLWLLFYPNSPYIITDYIHLRPEYHVLRDVTSVLGITQRIYVFNDDIELWIEFVGYTIGIFLGFFAGFYSLKLQALMLESKFGRKVSAFFVVIVHLLTGYAITIGRFARWNSWDALKPTNIPKIIVDHWNLKSLQFTLLFAVLSGFLYWLTSAVGKVFTHEYREERNPDE